MHTGDNSSDVFSLSLLNPSIPTKNKRNSVGNNRQFLPSIISSIKDEDVNNVSEEFVFKVTDGQNSIHRIKCAIDNIQALRAMVAEKIRVDGKNQFEEYFENVVLTYVDDENDEVKLTDSASLLEAVDLAKTLNLNALKLSVVVLPMISKQEEILVTNSQCALPEFVNHVNNETVDIACRNDSSGLVAPQEVVNSPAVGGNSMLYIGLAALAVAGIVGFTLLRNAKPK